MINNSEYKILLNKIKKEFINEFCDEKLVNDSFSNVNINSCNNIYDYLIENKLMVGIAKQNKDSLSVIGGLYFSYPIIDYDENNNYIIKDIKRNILIRNLDLNNKTSVAALVHELGHLVKSYNNEFVIKGDMLINQSGLITKYLRLRNVFFSTLEHMECVGFEEGLNTYLEENIMQRLGYNNYISLNYLGSNNIARDLINTLDIYEDIKYAQITHNKDYLRYLLGYNFDTLSKLIDEVNMLDSKMLINESEEDKNKKIDELLTFIDNNYYPIKNDIIKQLKKKER